MKRFILDTDTGIDCDDAAAIALLLNHKKKGECDILGITASSVREGATAVIRVICDYYSVDLPIGAMALPGLKCDEHNRYAKYIKDKYGAKDSSEDAVKLMRRLLGGTEEKADIITIGPLTNIARLLRSEPDGFSALDGVELVREKVNEMFCMGGRFAQNYGKESIAPEAEWNILQDIKSAQYVAENFPSRMLFCPFEAGENVFTAMGESDNPVWECMKRFVISGGEPFEPNFVRPSWDPVTCLCALGKDGPYFIRSAFGKVRIDDGGVSTFRECDGGNSRILLIKENSADIAELINGGIEPV